MKLNNFKRISAIFFIFLLISVTFNKSESSISNADLSENIPEGLKKLLKAYPDFLDSAGEKTLYWKDGTEMIYDDGIENKSHDEKLDNPDLEDMMSQEYIQGDIPNDPAENIEPGRIRYEPFFRKMYGNNASEVKQNIENVKWVDGSMIQFSAVNGASDKLRLVAEELSRLPAEYQKYLKNIGGTFVWRNIAGTNRLSNHSFGTAIDINTKFSDYWQWNKNMSYSNRIPFEIVEIFEKYGFIWGGKWYHYDTMHFEYRPELLEK